MTWLLPPLPLRHLDRAEIMRRIHIPGLPPPRNLLAQIRSHVMVRQLLYIGRGAGYVGAFRALAALEQAIDGAGVG